jgi:hypothetical protein
MGMEIFLRKIHRNKKATPITRGEENIVAPTCRNRSKNRTNMVMLKEKCFGLLIPEPIET